jgi:hypothetical protein
MSYSSIAAVCNTSKTNVMNCLKEIFSNMLHLIKQGSEITLDIKIGIVQIMNNNKLMFRNYNPDVKIRNKRNMSNNETFSERSGAPTSVATPLTNMSSTMSYRGQSQNMARTLNHVGIKRSGPAYEFKKGRKYITDIKKIRIIIWKVLSMMRDLRLKIKFKKSGRKKENCT